MDIEHLFLLPACMSVSIVVLYLFDQYVPVLTGVYLFRFSVPITILCAIDGGLLFELSYVIVNSKSSDAARYTSLAVFLLVNQYGNFEISLVIPK